MSDAGVPHLLAAPDPFQAPPLRWGILGAGFIAGTFATDVPTYSAQRVVAVGSRDLDRARAFASRHRIENAYGSYAELVAAPEVEAVYVATPHSHHHEHALLALEAGKPVLVEKAFTRNRVEAQEIFDLAAERGLFVMEAMWSRFLPHTVALRSLLASGAMGELLVVEASHGERSDHLPRLRDPALAGGALLDLGVYTLSFIHNILGAPSAVHATGACLETGVDAQEIVTLRYDGSPVLGVSISTMLAGTHTRASIAGRDGRVDIEGPFFRPTTFTFTPVDGEAWSWSGPTEAPAGLTRPTSIRGHSGASPEHGVLGGFQYQAAEVARCVRAGRLESEAYPWRTTLEVMDILDEARRQLGVVYPGEAAGHAL